MKEIGIKLALDGAAKVQSELKGVEAGLGRLGSSVKAVAANAGSFAASLGLGISLGKLVQVQREFDVLNASLTTVTGSGAAAAREMAWLKDFAKETPFGLAQATQGFVKMKALGLDPTRSALTSFGNTASAMGKDLNQMIEAVADASTGEFERLKEFGIKAKKEGDNVSLTFQGVTTTIKNSAEEITKYLEDIGNNQFGGAMAERAKTLDGAIAGLGDTWDELFRTVNERNAGTLIHDSVKLATGAIEDATTILRAMTGAANDNAAATGAMSTIQNGIATVFETVAVLGANLKYVLVQIGTEIGGLAAQVAQAAQFNFSGVAAIREQMVADAEEARRQIDATTARILGARKAQEEYARYATRNASAATDPRRIDLGKPTASGKPTGRTDTSINAANKALQDQAKLLAELSGLSGSFSADWAQLNTAYASGKLTLDGLTAAQAALLAKQPAIKAAADEENKAQDLLTKSYQDAAAERLKNVESMQKSADGLVSQNQALRDEIELIGLTEEQQTRVLQMRNEAIILTKEATLAELERANAITGTMTREQIALAAEIEALKERNELLGAKSVKNTAAEAAKKAEDEWKKTTDQINESLTDALMRGFESGKDFAKNMRDTVVNMFKTMVLRPTISAILAPVAGGVTGLLGLSGAANAGQGAANAGQGAGSLMGMASIASSAYNLVSGGLNVASQAGTWLSGKGTELALQYMGESAGTLLNNFALGMSSTSSMSAASAALQGVGADIAGLAVGSVLNGFSGYGISSALSGGYSAGGWVNTVAGIASAIPGVGPIAGVVGGAVNRAFGRKHTQTNLQGTFGGTTGFEGQWEDYYKGGWFRSSKSEYSPLDEETRGALAGQFNVMRVATAAMADVLGLGTDAISNFTASVNIKLKGLSAEDAQKKIQEEFDKIAESLARQTLGSDAFSRAGESSVQTLIRLSSSLTTVNSAFKMLDIEARDLQFANSLTGGKNASEYLDKFGGADVFNQLTASYYDAFYSEAEKTANVTKYITETLASVGLAMPTTREAFRDLTNEYLAMGIYGAETAAVLLGLSGAFAAIVPVTEAVTDSVQAMTQSLDDYISKTARSSTEAARIRGLASAGNNAALARLGVPGYASGGYHPGGLRLVGENGPELEVTGPSQIISSPVTADLLRGGGADTARLEALVEKLTAEVANLRAETRAVVTHTATTARIIKRVTPDGDALQTREVAAV